ncbi:hypothetical protein F5148DRAFT_1231946 [Russula earlei]|uniref:Uncharacterized protein n=1 Tax=Russula earlei TaxID=71964 RepID=A0ACC0TYG2_9AGAM|nr:hypothetical protein F5148DRAFT_1231946 [Russula earlei]
MAAVLGQVMILSGEPAVLGTRLGNFDFTCERTRREREYVECLRERKASSDAPPGGSSGGDGPGPGQRQLVHGGGGVFLR